MTLRMLSGGRSSQARRIAVALCAVAAGSALCGAIVPHGDIDLYRQYAGAMRHGLLSASLPKEYPALAGGTFLAVAELPLPYLFAFELVMAGALVCLVSGGLRLVRSSDWARRTLIYLVLGAGTLMFTRFDLLPATCSFIAVMSARRNRFALAWVLAGLGAALKFFPALLLPIFFLYESRVAGRAPWRRVAWTSAAVGALAIVQTVIAPGTLMNPVRFELDRGFEMYSVPGSLSVLANPLHLAWHHAFGGWQIGSSVGPEIAHLMTAGELLSALAICWAVFNRRLTLEGASLAMLSVAVLTDRALAPQYLIWLAPLWALWPARRGWLMAAALTFLTFPVSMGIASEFRLGFVLPTLMGALRNLVLVGATAGWLRDELKSSRVDALLTSEDGYSRSTAKSHGVPAVALRALAAPPRTRFALVSERKADV